LKQFNYIKIDKKKIIESLQNRERIQFECSTIQEIPGVEFLVKLNEVNCFIPLAANLKKITSKDLGVAHLFVRFKSDSTRHADTELVIPKSWDQYLNEPLVLPNWSSEMCLLDFLPTVQDVIMEMIDVFLKRKQLTEQLILQIGSPMEYDSNYKKISFYIDDKDTPYIIHITMSNYPKDKPSISFQSLNIPNHRQSSPYLLKIVSQIPWSPRWTVDELVKKLKPHLAEVSIEFKRSLIDEIIT